MKVLIIEDEQLVQEEFARLIRELFPDMEIMAMLSSVSDSVEWLNENKADLIFLDIHLSDGTGFDIFDQVNIETPVIFTTAYDQYAIRAFEVNGIGYLLKPISQPALIDTISRVRRTIYTPHQIEALLDNVRAPKEYKKRMLIKSGDRIGYINITEIAYFYAEDRVTFMVTHEGRRYLVDYTIEILERLLDPKQFFRMTRGCIASIESIESTVKYFNSRLKVTLNPKHKDEILISRVRVPDFLKWLDDL